VDSAAIDRIVRTLCVLLACALRWLDSPGRSLWLDEGTTLLRVWGTLAENLRNITIFRGFLTYDAHPQAFFLTFRVWLGMAGDTEFAIKFWPQLWGILLVPACYLLARRAGGRAAACVCAFFAAIAPGLHWYASEIRPYSMVAVLAAVSTYALLRGVHAGRWLVVWFLSLTAALFTHYSAAALAIAHACILLTASALLSALYRSLRALAKLHPVPIALGFAAVLVAGVFVAWALDLGALLARLRTGPEADFYHVPLHTMLLSVVQQSILGIVVAPNGDWFGWLLVTILPLAALAALRVPRRIAIGRLLFCFVVPLLSWFAISLLKPNFQNLRHLFILLPVLLALCATVVIWLLSRSSAMARVLGVAYTSVLVAAMLFGSVSTVLPGAQREDDWRSLAAYLRDQWQPDDVILTNAGAPEAAVAYYLRDIPARVIPTGLMPAAAEWFSRGVLARGGRVWLVNMGGKPVGRGDGEFDAWLAQAAVDGAPPIVSQRVTFGGRTGTVQLLQIQLHERIDQLPDDALRVSDASADPIAAVQIEPGAPFARHSNKLLRMFWRVEALSGGGDRAIRRVNIRLLAGDTSWLNWSSDIDSGVPLVEFVASAGRFLMTTHHVPVPLGLPAGAYRLELTLEAGAGPVVVQRAVYDMTAVQLERHLLISRWSPGMGEGQTAVALRLPPLAPVDSIRYPEHWLQTPARSAPNSLAAPSADIDLVQATFADVARPGQLLPVAVVWRPKTQLMEDWDVILQLAPLIGAPSIEARKPAGVDGFRPMQWPTGRAVRDQLTLAIPNETPPGRYRLLATRARGGRIEPSVELGWLRLDPHPPSPIATAIPSHLEADVDALHLLGYELPKLTRDSVVEIRTFWRVDRKPTRDGVLFVHFIKPDGTLGTSDDVAPDGGVRSTLSYAAGDGITIVHRVRIPADAPSAGYRMFFGVYDRATVERWPVTRDGAPGKDNLIDAGSVAVVE
jgi:uncharacterized membrane protein